MAIIDKPSDYFVANLHTGNGGTQTITTGIDADLIWIKNRTSAEGSGVFDTVRGATKMLCSQNTDGESTTANSLTAFSSNGFSVGANNRVNQNSNNIVSWNWKEQAGVFDIVSFTGNGTARTISHNLGSVPKFMIIKDRNNVRNWGTYHVSIGAGSDAGYLNNTVVPEANNNFWNNTTPTSSVFSVGTDGTYNANGVPYIVYLFGDSSMSKCGSYVGNGNANGTFVNTSSIGTPAFVMIKRTSSAESWILVDNKRNPFNKVNNYLLADNNTAEVGGVSYDFLSNGLKFVGTSQNSSGATYIYIIMSASPFQTSSGVPNTAR